MYIIILSTPFDYKLLFFGTKKLIPVTWDSDSDCILVQRIQNHTKSLSWKQINACFYQLSLSSAVKDDFGKNPFFHAKELEVPSKNKS
ncbi:unnamed protein product [Hermetia illucens]|uniref:Uncharacterized protein n=1 Tax=Hermetia illucens TaxID=343691 RepID=A0A7R8UVT3_HERIL|nr:unnamed protein product [Hermetia illucens]